MQIPVSFWLYGQKITVESVDHLIEDEDNVGEVLFRKNLIRLQRNNAGVTRPQTQAESTFCHELVHYILFMMEESDLRGNEKFVDHFGRLLHQALNSMEYE